MFTKAQIYNLSLSALLLQRQVVNPDTDTSNECKVLNNFYDVALNSALESMDLDATATAATLELITTDPTPEWAYAYKYPVNCAFFRRIRSCEIVDNRTTHIPKLVQMYGTPTPQKAIFTNKCDAIGEFIANDYPLSALSSMAAMTVAIRLAILAAPLITGKGAAKLKDELMKTYVLYKGEAQELDRRENFNFEADFVSSEFVEARTSF